MNNNELKSIVKQTYSDIALEETNVNRSSGCCCGGEKKQVYRIMSDEYSHLDGYNPDADLKLGCGLPTEYAKIEKGDTVVDLGSGAGNDCFVARHETGSNGKVIGIDFTEAMINKARENAEKLNYNNVEFRLGDIENIPVSDNVADVVVSNCVMNLVPNKPKAFGEVFRIIKPGGHFSISDIVLTGELPDKIKTPAAMYAGCVASAIQKTEYLQIIEDAGFENLAMQKKKPIIVPNEILEEYLSQEEIADYNSKTTVIYSITVYGEKPKGE